MPLLFQTPAGEFCSPPPPDASPRRLTAGGAYLAVSIE